MRSFIKKIKDSIACAGSKTRGVALLFVVLLTSVLFLVAIGITNVAYKELVFSLEARDSDLAFFAADTGIECGLYLYKKDFKMFDRDFIPYPTPLPMTGGAHDFTCNNTPLTLSGPGVAIGGVTSFALALGSQCVDVTVDSQNKAVPVYDSMGHIISYAVYPSTMPAPFSAYAGKPEYYTIITAHGYNASKSTSAGPYNCLPGTAPPTNLVSRVLQTTFIPGL